MIFRGRKYRYRRGRYYRNGRYYYFRNGRFYRDRRRARWRRGYYQYYHHGRWYTHRNGRYFWNGLVFIFDGVRYRRFYDYEYDMGTDVYDDDGYDDGDDYDRAPVRIYYVNRRWSRSLDRWVYYRSRYRRGRRTMEGPYVMSRADRRVRSLNRRARRRAGDDDDY